MKWVLVEDEHHRGSADPYVSRTILQAEYLTRYFQLDEKKEQGICSVFNEYRRHLHQCHDIAQRVIQEIEVKSQELKTTLANRSTEDILQLPSVRNLTNDVENFLYHAKLAFRELKDLFLYTQDKDFNEKTRYSHIAEWSEKRFGEDNPMSKWIRSNCIWIQKLIDSRNAVEHANCGPFSIRNFHLRENGNVSAPLWALKEEEPKSISRDMNVIPVNMLEYAEILLICALTNTKNIHPIVIAEIPEDKRDKNNPMRFIATLEQDLDEHGRYKYNRN